jgi:hypothetical protein
MPRRFGNSQDLDGRDYAHGDSVAPETAAAAAKVIARVSWCQHEQNITVLSALKRSEHASFLTLFESISNDAQRHGVVTRFMETAFRSHAKRDLYVELDKLTKEYAGVRNILAHSLWFGDTKRPDLLLVSPQLRCARQWVQAQRHMAAVRRHYDPRSSVPMSEKGRKAIDRAKIDSPTDALIFERGELERIADNAQHVILGWQKLQTIVQRGTLALPRDTAKQWLHHLRRDIERMPHVVLPPPPQPLPR